MAVSLSPRRKQRRPCLLGLLLFGSLLLFRSWQRSLVASLSKLYSTAASVEYAGRVEDRDYRYYGASTTGRSKNGTSGSSPQGESIRLWQDQNFSYLQSASGYVHSYPIQMNQTWPLEVSILGHVRPLTSPGPAPSPPDDDGEFTIRAVYFVNTKVNPNYAGWIRHQLASFGRWPVREIYLVADAALCSNETSLHEAYRWLREARTSDGCTVHLDCHDGPTETYEHHGIQKLWELGQVHHGERDVAVYLHSRGVTHASTWEEYSANDTFSTLTEDVFSQPVMDRTVDAFRLFPSVIMAGWDCSGGGWVWYNFFYVRGSYLKTVEQPVLATRRWYYEDWISRSGLEAQRGAPDVRERDHFMYFPTSPMYRPYSCYGLAADADPTAANMGYYLEPGSATRHRQQYPDLH